MEKAMLLKDEITKNMKANSKNFSISDYNRILRNAWIAYDNNDIFTLKMLLIESKMNDNTIDWLVNALILR